MAEFTAQVMYDFTGESETELSIRQNKEIFKNIYIKSVSDCLNTVPVLPASRKFSRRTKKWLIVIGSENRYGLTRPRTLATVVNK
jgi:hypothetical protein